MGIYINKGNEGFSSALRGRYVDKTGLIAFVNETLGTERRYTCVTRCRRFGKSMSAKMLYAYYDKSCDSSELFDNLDIAKAATYRKYLNKYPVISLDITSFTTRYRNDEALVRHIQDNVKTDVLECYPDVDTSDDDDLMEALLKITMQTGERFIVIIDEWDAILREMSGKEHLINEYLDLLRRMFKGDNSDRVFAAVYMTGILPIKKYSTQSALNNFREYSVVSPGKTESFFGFTTSEVATLVEDESLSVDELKDWYDGYSIGRVSSVYNPYSVIEAVANGYCGNNWSKTGAYEYVSTYIKRNYDGLKDDVIMMLAGGRCRVNTTKFQNDLSVITCKDDVLTVLIHLGYLAYDMVKGECYIPNKEVQMEMTNAIEATDWDRLNEALTASEKLLKDTLAMNEEAVANGIELAHDSETSILSYNDENSLSCVLSIAYYYARNDYVIHREMATGKGFADLVLVPRRNVDMPALVVELKYNKKVESAIEHIRQKNYPSKVADYVGNILLVAISYDKNGPDGKRHSCIIERC